MEHFVLIKYQMIRYLGIIVHHKNLPFYLLNLTFIILHALIKKRKIINLQI